MILILVIIFILIIISIALFFIFVKKFNGVKEVSIILLSTFLVVIGVSHFLKESKSEIINDRLYESKLSPINNYKILKSTDEGNWDYYYEYQLKISNEDKVKLIKEISDSKKFQKINKNEYDDFINNEYLKQLSENQVVQNFNVENSYFRIITFPKSSRKIEIEINSINNELKILDYYN